MKRFGISKQIILIAVLPALVVAAILSSYYIWSQFNYISVSLKNHGMLIAKQISPAAEYAAYSGNIDLVKPLVNSIVKNGPVLRVQIFDKNDNTILDISKPEDTKIKDSSILKHIFEKEKQLKFSVPILVTQIPVEDTEDPLIKISQYNKNIYIGKTVVTITTRYATEEKIEQIKHGTFITMAILLLAIIVIIQASNSITKPIISLTNTVKNIAAGNLETRIDNNASGEVGVLQSCVTHMANELKRSQSDMESQIDEYTQELQETMEELEIRNAELDITRSKAIYANNAKSEFLANMSHEIRTPLSGIIGFTELLQGTQLTSQQRDYSSTIHKSSKHLLEIINDVLDLSKIESGKTEITTSEFNLIDIIEDIINLLSTSALEKNIELLYRFEKDVPTTIQSDPFRIHQILTNLIGNAIKFTDKGYVYLQVAMGEIEDAEVSIKFTVSDTGIGMSSTDKNKLFKAFTQADTSITRRFGGTGLGLVISRKLTMLMHGEIGFDSTEGEGSTFWFSVPVVPRTTEIKHSELNDKKIAFISNHFIAKQAYKTLFENWHCQVDAYPLKNLNNLADIESANDILVFFLSRQEIENNIITENLGKFTFSKPSMLIASTRSHSELRNLQQHNFDSAVFTSEKIEIIKQKLINTINRKTSDDDTDTLGNTTHASIDWSNINILVVDDNDINLRLAEIILHRHKARVTTAHSGAQAIDYASMNSYDIIFMDLHMPGLDGYETTQKIREITPGKQPVIIALTANAMPQEKDKVIESSMNGLLIKPVSSVVMQKIVKQWVLKESIKTPDIGKTDIIDTPKTTHVNEIFSIDLAKEFTGNNEELAYELFGMLRGELENYKAGITEAVRNNSLSDLREQVHKLHGASRCCGTSELKQVSSHIETLINQNINFDIEHETSLLLKAIQNVVDYKVDIDS